MMIKDMKIRSLLAVILLFLGLLLASVGATGVYGIRSTNEALTEASENVPTVIAVHAQLDYIMRTRLRLDRAAAIGDQQEITESLPLAKALISDSERAWATYQTYPADSDEKVLANDVTTRRNQLLEGGIKPLMAALQTSDIPAARSLAFSKIPSLFQVYSESTTRLERFQVDDSTRLASEGRAHERKTMMVTVALTLVGLSCAFAAWLTLMRAISRPLDVAVQHFEEIEAGNLTGRIEAARDDELGALLVSLARMQAGLRKTVVSVCVGVERVGQASAEIASGTADLSRRTERQAVSLEETAASMEELTTTVRNNAEHASEASALSKQLVEVAQVSSEAVHRLAGTMRDVKDGSGEIAEISAVIEGIAFQTNILSLNAAVEAARAGAQGRGFAVVATEVRALALRSGAAAKEIKELISTSVSRADAGAQQAVEASQRMNDVQIGIDRVATLLGHIAVASQEQARGIEQVTSAIADMDGVTQQNASLVEQSVSVCELLGIEAARMHDAVAVFQTGGHAA